MMFTVKRSDCTHSFTSPIENVQELIKGMNEEPTGFNVTVSNEEGASLEFYSPPTRKPKSEIKKELLRLQELM